MLLKTNTLLCKGYFFDDNEMEQAEKFAKMGIDKSTELYCERMRIRLDQLSNYNEGTESKTTVEFFNGTRISIDISFDEFDKIYCERMGEKP